MAKKKVEVVIPKKEVIIEEVKEAQIGDEITFHLDRDPNDPRNAAKPNKLPSLND